MSVPRIGPAVRVVAGREWRLGRRSLVVIGLAAGLLGGLLAATATMTLRAATAPARLVAEVDPGDAQVLVFAGPALRDRIVALDSVTDHVEVPLTVGRLRTDAVQYVGMSSLPTGPLLRPVVVDGRRPDPDVATEVLVLEHLAEAVGIGAGDRITVSLLTAAEVFEFDTGFGEPDGATVELLVTGTARVPPGVFDSSPVLTTPAFASAYPESIAGSDLTVRLEGGAEELETFRREVEALGLEAAPSVGGEEFLPAIVEDPRAPTRVLERSSRVLIGGLALAVATGALALVLALAQTLGRQIGARAGDQRVERALGMTVSERTLARTIPVLPSAVVVGALTALGGLLGGWWQPVGPLGRVEPDRGWRPEPAVAVAGAALTAVVVAGLAATAAARSGRILDERRSGPRVVSTGATRFAPRRPGWILAGTAFALSPRARHGRLRTSLLGVVVGVAGLAAGLTVGASLDRLTSTPERYGWTVDLAIADVDDTVVAELAADPRFATVIDARAATVRLGGDLVQAYAWQLDGEQDGWTYHAGRGPRWSGEIAVGTRIADRFDLRVGDRIDLDGFGPVVVTGVGLGPPLTGEPLGASVLLDAAVLDPDRRAEVGAEEVSADAVFREALVEVAAGQDTEAVARDLAERYEVAPRGLPREVRDLADLGRIPQLLGAFLALLGGLALAHAVVVTARQRASDLAVLRALGATAGQSALSVVATAVALTAVGLLVGLPLGWAVARLVWGSMARSVGVAPGVAVPWSVTAAAIGALALAAAVSVVPARAVARRSPAAALRAE